MVSQAMQEAGEVALVVDAWTSASGGHYVSIMAHWCDADNHMRHALLRTVEFKRKDQTPEALAQALAACVDSYAIGKCVWAIVSNDRCNMMSVCAQLRTMLGSPIEHFQYERARASENACSCYQGLGRKALIASRSWYQLCCALAASNGHGIARA